MFIVLPTRVSVRVSSVSKISQNVLLFCFLFFVGAFSLAQRRDASILKIQGPEGGSDCVQISGTAIKDSRKRLNGYGTTNHIVNIRYYVDINSSWSFRPHCLLTGTNSLNGQVYGNSFFKFFFIRKEST